MSTVRPWARSVSVCVRGSVCISNSVSPGARASPLVVSDTVVIRVDAVMLLPNTVGNLDWQVIVILISNKSVCIPPYVVLDTLYSDALVGI